MKQPVYFGTYTHGDSSGLYRADFDALNGELSEARPAAALPNPTFLVSHPHLPVLYSVSEDRSVPNPSGMVRAFRRDPRSGGLCFLNEVASGGRGPCHISVHPAGRLVFVANYSGGSISVLPLAEDGALRPATRTLQHRGTGPNPQRQEAAHPHSVNPSPDGRFLFVPDLGLDQVLVYRVEAEHLIPAQVWRAAPGAGPRHLAFAGEAQNPFVYVLNELDATVAALQWDGSTFREQQVLPTLPTEFAGTNTASEISVHPNQRAVYAGNRGHDSVAVLERDPVSGRLALRTRVPSGGAHPRHFALHPDGNFLLVANRDSDRVLVFRVEADGAVLRPTGREICIPQVVCVRFVQ